MRTSDCHGCIFLFLRGRHQGARRLSPPGLHRIGSTRSEMCTTKGLHHQALGIPMTHGGWEMMEQRGQGWGGRSIMMV